MCIFTVSKFSMGHNYAMYGYIALKCRLQFSNIRLDNAKRGIPSQGAKVDLDI